MRHPKTALGTNSEGAAAHNRRVVMQALRLNGRLSRAEIARGTGLVPQTVSNIIEQLEGEGLVIAAAPVRGKRGQPATPYSISPGGAFALGLQIDQHRVRSVAVDLLGNVVSGTEIAFDAGGLEQNLPHVRAAVDDVLATLRARSARADPPIVGLGLAMPAPTGFHAVKDDPWMAAPGAMHPMVAALEAMTGLPVSLHHDASAAAVAERLTGVVGGNSDFVHLFIGYGLGAGLYVRGELHVGGNHLAGEIGQIPFPDGNRMVPLERLVSLASLYERLGLQPNDRRLFERIDQCLDERPRDVAAWLDGIAPHLVWLVDTIQCLLDPSYVVIGGQMPRRLMAAIYERVAAASHATPAPDGIVRPRLLMGSADVFSVATGAAAYPIAKTFDPSLSAILKDADDTFPRLSFDCGRS